MTIPTDALIPHLAPSLRAVPLDDGIVLVAEAGSRLLIGRGERAVLLRLDGRRSVGELVADLAPALSPAVVYATLQQLAGSGVVVWAGPENGEEPAEPDPALDVKRDTVGVRLDGASPHRVGQAVAVRVVGEVDSQPLVAALAGRGIAVHRDAAAQVVVSDDYLRRDLAVVNAAALAAGRPWLLAKPLGGQTWLGPLFRPGRGGCWACLAQRLGGHRRVDLYLAARNGGEIVPAPDTTTAAARAQAADRLASAIAHWLAVGSLPDLEGAVVSLEETGRTTRHVLVRRPQCPACGPACDTATAGTRRARQDRAMAEAARPDPPEPPLPPGPTPAKAGAQNGPQRPSRPAASAHERGTTHRTDGGYRLASPEATFARLEHHISPVTGVVRELVELPRGDGPDAVAPTFVAYHAFDAGIADATQLATSLSRAAGGKGLGRDQARASALCEALERYSGVFQGDEPRRRARLADLGTAGIHPDEFQLFSARQLDSSARDAPPGPGGSALAAAQRVPARFDSDTEIEWTPLESLTHGHTRFLPTACCYFGYAARHGVTFAEANSNGCAAGTGLDEAILQGFLELVERDSVALWWYNRCRRPAVDLAGWPDPRLAELVDDFARRGRSLWALDLTTDLGIPAFAAISRCETGPEEALLLGFGAHLDAGLALARALTELTQSLAAVPAPGARVAATDPRRSAIAWWRTARLAEHSYLAPDPDQPPRGPADFAVVPAGEETAAVSVDLGAAVADCVERARRAGLETLVLDQTRPDIGLTVVRVVVPGLRHFWPRFAPGRLYDVPVALGWVTGPTPEAELNPVPVYL